MKQDESMVTWSFQQQLDLEENYQVTKWKIEYNVENGEKYVGISKTPYQNLMLDKWFIRIKEMQGTFCFYHKRW
jgi:hypothetical protein